MEHSSELEDFLSHYGVPGMKWGRRSASSETKPTNSEIKNAQKEVRQIQKDAKSSIKLARKAKTPEERKVAAEKYKKEVSEKINSKEFKDAWDKANRQTRGQIATQLILLGPIGASNIAITSFNKRNRKYGLEQERTMAKQILEELRTL